MKIILLRLGSYGEEPLFELTENEKQQMEKVAEILKKFGCNNTTTIFTSPVRRAFESAEIIYKILSINDLLKRTEALNGSKYMLIKFLEEILISSYEIIILITHLPEIKETITYFNQRFNLDFHGELKLGEALIVDFDSIKCLI